MKPIFLFIFMHFLLFIISCNENKLPAVVFAEAQPKGVSGLLEIPKKLHGSYYNTAENSTLVISSNLIYKSTDHILRGFYKDIEEDSAFEIVGDSLVDLTNNESYKIERIGDSIYFALNTIDTLYKRNQNYILKRFKGRFFLNEKQDKHSWKTQQVILNKGVLSLSNISEPINWEKLETINENPLDNSLPKNISPSKREFKKLLKDEVFNDKELYIKIKTINP